MPTYAIHVGLPVDDVDAHMADFTSVELDVFCHDDGWEEWGEPRTSELNAQNPDACHVIVYADNITAAARDIRKLAGDALIPMRTGDRAGVEIVVTLADDHDAEIALYSTSGVTL